MPEDPYAEEGDDNRPWDEHRWERFLQESDRRTEKFGQLLEKYQDHPDRDAIVAKEMGWDLEPEGDDEELEAWQKEQLAEIAPSETAPVVDPGDEDDGDEDDGDEDDGDEDDGDDDDDRLDRRQHPLFLEAQAYVHRLLKVVVDLGDQPAHRPIHEALTGGAMICAAKLSVLSLGKPSPELGMIIAYAKRGLKSLTDSLGALDPARRAGLLSAADALSLQNQAFQVRSGIISLMGDLRAEFRRRYQ